MKKRIEHKKFPLIFAKGVVLGLLLSHQIAEAELEKPLDEETDYSDPGNWFKIPEITKAVDTFFIYPTVYINYEDDALEYAPIGDASMTEGVKMMYAMQASVFEESTNLFMPFYRQANLKTAANCSNFTGILKDHYPEQDINAALDYYFENKNPHLRFAEGADDTGVIVSWNIEGPGNKGCKNMVVLDNAVSINPLNWKRDDTYASAEENLGSLVPDDEETDSTDDGSSLENMMGVPEFKIANVHADAQVDLERGTVICTTKEYPCIEVGEGVPQLFGPESFHNGDYSLFFKNIQENVKTRIEAWK